MNQLTLVNDLNLNENLQTLLLQHILFSIISKIRMYLKIWFIITLIYLKWEPKSVKFSINIKLKCESI